MAGAVVAPRLADLGSEVEQGFDVLPYPAVRVRVGCGEYFVGVGFPEVVRDAEQGFDAPFGVFDSACGAYGVFAVVEWAGFDRGQVDLGRLVAGGLANRGHEALRSWIVRASAQRSLRI